MSDEEHTQTQIDILKELIGEVRQLGERIQALETENHSLKKATDKIRVIAYEEKNGWHKFTTPHADETFDPLKRETPSVSTLIHSSCSGDLFLKSRDEVLEEWKEAERQVKA